MNFLRKLQDLPEQKRKIILWLLVVLIALCLLPFYIKNVQQRLKIFQGGGLERGLKILELQEELKKVPKLEMPKFEIPKISEEELKKLEEEIQKGESNGQ